MREEICYPSVGAMDIETCLPGCESPQDGVTKDTSDEETNVCENASWADAMSKVLHSKPNNRGKHFILAKAKHDAQIKKQRTTESQIKIIDTSGEVLKDDGDTRSQSLRASSKGRRRNEVIEQQIKRVAWENMCRSKPDSSDRERERQLMKVATRSVVQLFNAVQKHQKGKDEKIQTIVSRKESLKKQKAIKGNFLDILKSSIVKPAHSVDQQQQQKTHSEQETWSVLKDDFLMGTTLKDWDKSSDDDIEIEN